MDSVVFLLPQEQVYSGPIDLAGYLQCKVRLMHCMMLFFCIWRGFEAIVMLEGYCYSDSLVLLLIHSLYTTAESARNRSLTNFFLKINCYVSYRT